MPGVPHALTHRISSTGLLLGDIANKRFCLLRSMLPFRDLFVCLFVWLSVAFVHCAQTAEDIDTISFAYDIRMYQQDRVKIWLT